MILWSDALTGCLLSPPQGSPGEMGEAGPSGEPGIPVRIPSIYTYHKLCRGCFKPSCRAGAHRGQSPPRQVVQPVWMGQRAWINCWDPGVLALHWVGKGGSAALKCHIWLWCYCQGDVGIPGERGLPGPRGATVSTTLLVNLIDAKIKLRTWCYSLAKIKHHVLSWYFLRVVLAAEELLLCKWVRSCSCWQFRANAKRFLPLHLAKGAAAAQGVCGAATVRQEPLDSQHFPR